MREIYDLFSSLPPTTYTTVAFILGLLLVDDLTPMEQRSLGGFFVLMGETIWVNATQTELLQTRTNEKEIAKMRQEIEMLKQRLY